MKKVPSSLHLFSLLAILFATFSIFSCSDNKTSEDPNTTYFKDGLVDKANSDYYGSYFVANSFQTHSYLKNEENCFDYNQLIQNAIPLYLSNKLHLLDAKEKYIHSTKPLEIMEGVIENTNERYVNEYKYSSDYRLYINTDKAYYYNEEGVREVYEAYSEQQNIMRTNADAWYVVSVSDSSHLRAIYVSLVLPDTTAYGYYNLPINIFDYTFSKNSSIDSFNGSYLVSDKSSLNYNKYHEQYLAYFNEEYLVDLFSTDKIQFNSTNVSFLDSDDKDLLKFTYDNQKGLYFDGSHTYYLRCTNDLSYGEIGLLRIYVSVNICGKLLCKQVVTNEIAFSFLAMPIQYS